jgi:hypothetical protein
VFALLAGGATAVVAAPVVTGIPRGLLETVPLALLYAALVAGAAAAVGRWRSARLRGSRLLLGASVWLAPLVLLASAGSLWVLPVAAAFGALAATLFRDLAEDAPPEALESGKSFLLIPEASPGTRQRARGVKIATLVAYAGGIMALAGDLTLAAILFGAACAVVAWFGMAETVFHAKRKIAWALAATILALFPRGWVRFGPYQPPNPEGAEEGTGESSRQGLFAGVVLLTDAKSEPPLIEPPAPRLPSLIPTKPAQPASIPFTGEYWYFFWPLSRPGEDAIRKSGDPTELTYRAVDHSSLVMQARQPLPQPIDLSCCGAIDLVLRNREAQPDTIYIELALMDSKGGKPREQSLSGKRLPASAATSTNQATLRFDLPGAPEIRSFDEIVVWFHLDESRRVRSANLAIDRFDLIR